MKDRSPIFSRHKASIALLLVMVGLLWLRFPDFFSHGHEWLIEENGDAGKVYGVMEYHVRWDSTYSHYQGMNYPYGEHVIPADAMVLYTNTLKFLSGVFGDLSWHTRLMLHMGLLLSMLLCAWLMYRLFLYLEVPPWWAVVLAVGLAFLSPQLPRISAHFGLGHVAALPSLLWGLIRFEQTGHWRHSLVVALIISAFSLLHFYFFAIMGMFVGLYMGFRFLQRPGLEAVWYYARHFGIQVLLPFVCFYLWMNFQDLVPDRPSKPWGFLYYKSDWEAVFTSMTQPHWRYLHENIRPVIETKYEGRAYVGFIAMLGLLALVVRWGYGVFRRPIVAVGGKTRPFWNAAFWAALVLMVFSMGYPFVWPGMEHWVDYAGPLRQFRSIGRFNWVFFYVLNLIVFAELWRWVRASGTEYRKFGIFLAALLVMLGEAYFYQRKVDARMEQSESQIPGMRYADIEGIDFSEYQAILTIPYFNIGSDNIWVDPVGLAIPRTMSLSAATGLPVSAAMLTRTSLRQTLRQVELILEPYRVPRIFEDYPSDKPLLLLVTKGPEIRIEPHRHLWEGLEPLFTGTNYELFRLPLSLYAERVEARRAEAQALWEQDSLPWYSHGAYYSLSETPDFILEHFDDLVADRFFRGAGALQAPGSERTLLYDGSLPGTEADTAFVFSLWLYMATDLAARGQFLLELLDSTGAVFHTQHNIQIYNYLRALDEDWGQLEWKYTFNERPPARVRLYYQSPEMNKASVQIDELLLRTRNAQVMRQLDEGYWWNGLEL